MKNLRLIATALVAAAALALAACGGGGGGGDSPAPPTPTPTDQTPPVLTVATSSPMALTGTVVVTSNEDLGGNVSVEMRENDLSVATGSTSLNADNRGMTWRPSEPLKCNTVYVVRATGTDLAGNTGTVKDVRLTTAACPDNGLHYTDKVMAVWTFGKLYSVTKTGVTLMSGQGNVINCGLPADNVADGHVLAECTDTTVSQRRLYQVDPVAGSVSPFGGTAPAGMTFVVTESSSTQPVANTTSARVADGWFYAEPTSNWVLKFQADAGGTTIVKAGTFAADGNIKVLRSYSN